MGDFIKDRGDRCRYYWWMGFVLAICVVVGFSIGILIIDSNYLFAMFGVLGFAILEVYIFNWGVRMHYQKGWNQCLLHIEQYIDTEVNSRYTTDGVSWMMRERTVWHGCGKDRYRIKY